MKKKLCLAVTLVFMSWGQASADHFDFNGTFTVQDWLWNYSTLSPQAVSSPYSMTLSGQLVATSNGDGSFTATAGSGTANGVPIEVALSSLYGLTYNNTLYPGAASSVDSLGLLFTTSASTPLEISIVDSLGLYYFAADNVNWNTWTDSAGGGLFTVAVAAAPVPEPAAGWLLGTGLIGLIWIRRFRK